MAAGLTLKADKVSAFEEFVSKRIADDVDLAGEDRAYKVDGVVSPGGATRDLLALVEQAGPFGAGNPEPRFALPQVRVVNASRVGADHVRCVLLGEDGKRLKGIAWRVADTPLGQSLLEAGGRVFHIAGRLKADNWQGRRNVQLTIEDAVAL